MTAFDQAWDLVKMPLVRDSIEYGEPDSTGFPTATALFQHPHKPEIQYKMNAWEDQGGTRMAVDNPLGPFMEKRAGWAYFRTPWSNEFGHTKTSDISTKQYPGGPDYRRLGIATAMYDLINEMTQRNNKNARVVSSPALLSEENARLWDKALRRSRGFGIGVLQGNADLRSKNKNSREQIMWPEKGVFE